MNSLMVGALVLLAFSIGAVAEVGDPGPATAAPATGTPVLGGDPFTVLQLDGAEAAGATVQMVPVEGQRFAKAWRIRTTKEPATPYATQMTAPTGAPVAAGAVLHLSFWMRCIEGREQGEARTEFVFEKRGAPWTKSVAYDFLAGGEWKRLEIPFVAKEPYAAGKAQICFRLGYTPQTLELAGLELLNYGTSVKKSELPFTRATYAGQEPDAAWRREAEARIERIRKADLNVIVCDAAGQPIGDASVNVAMKRHEFGFGTAVSAFYLEDGKDSADKERYRSELVRLFNKAVLENALKWPPWEGSGRGAALKTITWLRAQGLDVRGHCLVWPSWKHTPGSLKALQDDRDALAAGVRKHILDEAGATRNTLVEWDVINEPFDNHDLMDVLGPQAMSDWFRCAREADPDVKLFINDYAILSGGDGWSAHRQHYEDTIRLLIDGGAPLDGIGMQCHFGSTATPPHALLATLDRFANFGKTIEVTEFDINSDDKQFQAEYTRDFMIALFSHPAVNGILMWGFWDGKHWHHNAPIFREDWSLKPSGQVWIDQVFARWWTSAQLTTDAHGACTVRGFRGTYELTVSAGGRTQTLTTVLPQGGATVTVQLP